MVTVQLFAIFAFGLVVAGVVFLGIIRAREYGAKKAKAREVTEPES